VKKIQNLKKSHGCDKNVAENAQIRVNSTICFRAGMLIIVVVVVVVLV